MATPVVLKVGRILDFVHRFGGGLSETGLYVPSKTPLAVGAEVEIRVVAGIGKDVLFEAQGKVARRDSTGFQVTFTHMAPTSRALVELACAARAILSFAAAASKTRPAGVADSVEIGDDAPSDGLDEDTTGKQILPTDLDVDTGKLTLPPDLSDLADSLEPEETSETLAAAVLETTPASAPVLPAPPIPSAPPAPPPRATRPSPAPPPPELLAPRPPPNAPPPPPPNAPSRPFASPVPSLPASATSAGASVPISPPASATPSRASVPISPPASATPSRASVPISPPASATPSRANVPISPPASATPAGTRIPAPSASAPPPIAPASARVSPAPSPSSPAAPLAESDEPPRTTTKAPSGALVLGIDLGTTFSCAAVVKDGQTIVIPAQTGDRTFPSVVSVTTEGELVGWPAYARLATHSKDTIYGSKRILGRSFDSQPVQEAIQHFDYEVLPGEDGSAAVRLAGSIYSLTWVAARILEEIHGAAVRHLGQPIEWAVITVPAHYSDRQRQAVVMAAAEAGLQVLQIVNEPTAAAIAYGIDRGLTQKVMVYDFGGGTFDVSILDIQGNVIEVIASGGDSYLGGVDLDNRIVDWALGELSREHQVDLSGDKISRMRIRQAAETSKRELSLQAEARVHVPFITIKNDAMLSLDLVLTRETLNRLVMELVDRTIEICKKTLEDAKLTKEDIAEVLFVGGQSRTPLVQGKVHAFMGKQPRKGVHPDEAVAIGAALLAHSRDKIDSVTLLDVLSHSIGIGMAGGAFKTIIAKGSRLPARGEIVQTTTADGQASLAIDVYQGESETVDRNDFLGSVRLTGLPAKPKGELAVHVQFALDAQGFLQVTCTDNASQKTRVVRLTTRDRPESLKDAIAAREAAPAKPDDKKPGLLGRVFGRS